MSIGGGTVSNGSNSVQVTTYNNSHGTNGSLEATIDFEENAQFGFALRHTGE